MSRETECLKGMVKITCPICNRFLAYVPKESDVFCPRCRKWIYEGIGGGDDKQKGTGAKTGQ